MLFTRTQINSLWPALEWKELQHIT
ncbi:unnamed protein product [Macrosiphum euphorbiae]|uniref:Uncharacterized protein n=1 Tax=Macrosiphum euphorbiae TaxID=13131 RepID=A0AAV0WET9_9HEMI|nr:unnamed protein product [Macrosiphum euphorbiae]